MIARDLRQEAVDQLYGGEPAEFLTHRKQLAAAARAAKDRDAATAIAALRKPTRSAHLLNQLARREPERVDELLGLADDATAGAGRSRRDALRAMRELTARRRRLIDDLADRAFAGAGGDAPTPGVRDEVVATLNAAVGDPDVGAELAEGRLVRSHEWSGFGFSAADLALVPDEEPEADTDDDVEETDADAETDDDADETDEDEDEDDETGDVDQDDGPADAADPFDEQDDEDSELDEKSEDDEAFDEDDQSDDSEDDGGEDDDSEREAPEDDGSEREDPETDDADDPAAEARAALHEADQELKGQQRAELDQQDRIAELEDELTEAQIRLDEIRLSIRRAEMAQRRAASAVERLRRTPR